MLMQLGISSYAYSWAIGIPGHLPEKPLTVAGLIDKARQLHIDCIQIADNLPLHNLSWDKLKSIADQARTSGIRVEVGSRGLTGRQPGTLSENSRNLFFSPVTDGDRHQNV